MGNPINVEIVDSRDNPKICYLIVGDCKAQVLKARIKDFCYVLTVLDNVCHIKLDDENCEEVK